MASMELNYERKDHPVDLVEAIASTHDWAFERSAEDELSLCVTGTWSDYQISLNWRDDLEALHLAWVRQFPKLQPAAWRQISRTPRPAITH